MSARRWRRSSTNRCRRLRRIYDLEAFDSLALRLREPVGQAYVDALRPHVDALLDADDLEPALRRFASVLQAGVLAAPVARVRRVVIAEAQHFPAVSRAYAESWDRNVAVLAEAFAELMRRGSLVQHDPELAARQFTWLVLADPLNTRSLGRFSDQLDAERLAATADEAVETFAARFVAPRP